MKPPEFDTPWLFLKIEVLYPYPSSMVFLPRVLGVPQAMLVDGDEPQTIPDHLFLGPLKRNTWWSTTRGIGVPVVILVNDPCNFQPKTYPSIAHPPLGTATGFLHFHPALQYPALGTSMQGASCGRINLRSWITYFIWWGPTYLWYQTSRYH